MAQYIQVNMGRNVDDEPMDADTWAAFRAAVAIAITNACQDDILPDIEAHAGAGTWGDVPEESLHLSAFGAFDVRALRGQLRVIRARYGQDAIALIVGSELV